MHNWFECKVSYEKMLESGMQKKVTEPYLVDALSFTEAEARIIEEIKPFITGEFTISDIKRARLSELFFNENGDRFYKIKVYFISLDEKSGAEKKTAVNMLAQASDIKEAISVLENGMKGTLSDYSIASVVETQIMDVFPFSAEVNTRVAAIEQVQIENSLNDNNASIEKKMEECKRFILEKPKESDDELISKTFSYIQQKALYDRSKYKEAAIEMAMLQPSLNLQCWYLGCGQLLLERIE